MTDSVPFSSIPNFSAFIFVKDIGKEGGAPLYRKSYTMCYQIHRNEEHILEPDISSERIAEKEELVVEISRI